MKVLPETATSILTSLSSGIVSLATHALAFTLVAGVVVVFGAINLKNSITSYVHQPATPHPENAHAQ